MPFLFERCRGRVTTIVAVVLLGLAATPAGAEMAVIDQENPVTAYALNATEPESLGQEFVPTLEGMDALDLRMQGGSETETANVFVNIREATMDGLVVGSSSPRSIPRRTT